MNQLNELRQIKELKNLKEFNSDAKLKSFMERLKTLTDFIGVESEILPPSEELNAEQLIISLSDDNQETMQVMFVTDLFGKTEDSVILQLMCSLNVVANESNIVALAALIARVNPILPVGSFGITGADNLYMRQTIMAKSKDDVDLAIVVETIDMMTVFINLIGSNLKLFIEGQISFEDCLNKVQEFITP